MKFRITFLVLLLGIVSLVSAQVTSHKPTVFKSAPATSSAQSPAQFAVARVNGAVLTNADLVREEYAIFPYAKQHNGGIPKEFEKEIRDGALKMIIFEELVYQEALRRNMTVTAARLQRAQADFRGQFSTPDEFNAFVKSEFNGSQQLLQEKVRRSLLIDALLQAEVESKCKVSAAELKTYYDTNPARFERPETYRFQSISILPPQAPAATPAKDMPHAPRAR